MLIEAPLLDGSVFESTVRVAAVVLILIVAGLSGYFFYKRTRKS